MIRKTTKSKIYQEKTKEVTTVNNRKYLETVIIEKKRKLKNISSKNKITESRSFL